MQFAIYETEQGGFPIWTEIQNVDVATDGRYDVVIGTVGELGIPAEILSSEHPLWLETKIEGELEAARSRLVSVPYALKAADSEALSGQSASEFVKVSEVGTYIRRELAMSLQASASDKLTMTASGSEETPEFQDSSVRALRVSHIRPSIHELEAVALSANTNVKNYGAIGDGKTDDTRAIQAAINAASSRNGGIVLFPPGQFLISHSLSITTSGIILQGAGGHPSTTVKGTQIISINLSGEDVIKIDAEKRVISNITIRDLYVRGAGQTSSGGHGIHVDATRNTIARVNIQNVWSSDNAKDGVFYHAGQGSGGFIFDCEISQLHSIRNGGSGFKALGRVSQIHAARWYVEQNTGDQIYIAGGFANEASSLHFDSVSIGSESPAMSRSYALRLEDTESVNIFGIYTEAPGWGNILLQSARRTVIYGGTISQSGSAYGITFGNGKSSRITDNVIISVPGWSNTSTKKRINYVAGTIRELHLGLSADGRLQDSDISGAFSPPGEVFFQSGTGIGTQLPAKCRVGDLFFKRTTPTGLSLCVAPNHFQVLKMGSSAMKSVPVDEQENSQRYVEAKVADPSRLPNGTLHALTSIVLDPGEWDLSANVAFSGSTDAIRQLVSISTSDSSVVPPDQTFDHSSRAAFKDLTNSPSVLTPTYRVKNDSQTRFFLLVFCDFSVGDCLAQGTLRASRTR